MNIMASVFVQTTAAPRTVSDFASTEINPSTNPTSEFAEFLQSSTKYSGNKTTQQESFSRGTPQTHETPAIDDQNNVYSNNMQTSSSKSAHIQQNEAENQEVETGSADLKEQFAQLIRKLRTVRINGKDLDLSNPQEIIEALIALFYSSGKAENEEITAEEEKAEKAVSDMDADSKNILELAGLTATDNIIRLINKINRMKTNEDTGKNEINALSGINSDNNSQKTAPETLIPAITEIAQTAAEIFNIDFKPVSEFDADKKSENLQSAPVHKATANNYSMDAGTENILSSGMEMYSKGSAAKIQLEQTITEKSADNEYVPEKHEGFAGNNSFAAKFNNNTQFDQTTNVPQYLHELNAESAALNAGKIAAENYAVSTKQLNTIQQMQSAETAAAQTTVPTAEYKKEISYLKTSVQTDLNYKQADAPSQLQLSDKAKEILKLLTDSYAQKSEYNEGAQRQTNPGTSYYKALKISSASSETSEISKLISSRNGNSAGLQDENGKQEKIISLAEKLRDQPEHSFYNPFASQMENISAKTMLLNRTGSFSELRENTAAQLAERLSFELKDIPGGEKTFTMTLTPENLGKISVKIVSQAGKVSVDVTAEKVSTAQLLSEKNTSLTEAARANGVEITRYTVNYEPAEQPQNHNFGDGSNNGSGQQQDENKNNSEKQNNNSDKDNEYQEFAEILAAV